MKIINSENYLVEMKKNELIFIKFYREGCSPCERLTPVLKGLETRFPQVKFYEADVYENSELARAYKLRSVPVMVLVKSGERVGQLMGYHNEEDIIDMISENL